LEGTARILKFQPLCHRQGHQSPDLVLDQVAQGPIQSDNEHLQRRSIHSLPGQPVPATHHSLCKELPPDIQSKPSLLELKIIPPCPITIYPCKKLFSLLFIIPFKILEGCNEVSSQPSLLQAEQVVEVMWRSPLQNLY